MVPELPAVEMSQLSSREVRIVDGTVSQKARASSEKVETVFKRDISSWSTSAVNLSAVRACVVSHSVEVGFTIFGTLAMYLQAKIPEVALDAEQRGDANVAWQLTILVLLFIMFAQVCLLLPLVVTVRRAVAKLALDDALIREARARELLIPSTKDLLTVCFSGVFSFAGNLCGIASFRLVAAPVAVMVFGTTPLFTFASEWIAARMRGSQRAPSCEACRGLVLVVSGVALIAASGWLVPAGDGEGTSAVAKRSGDSAHGGWTVTPLGSRRTRRTRRAASRWRWAWRSSAPGASRSRSRCSTSRCGRPKTPRCGVCPRRWW